jgi:hypothetical protein
MEVRGMAALHHLDLEADEGISEMEQLKRCEISRLLQLSSKEHAQ